MKSKKTIFAAALMLGSLFTVSLTAQAQDNNTNTPAATAPQPGARHTGMTFGSIAKRLQLTDDQKLKAEPVITEFLQKTADLRKDTSLSREDRASKMKELRADTTAKLKDILTADQLTKWENLGQHHPNGAAGPSKN